MLVGGEKILSHVPCFSKYRLQTGPLIGYVPCVRAEYGVQRFFSIYVRGLLLKRKAPELSSHPRRVEVFFFFFL
jgi:hypothetical protein